MSATPQPPDDFEEAERFKRLFIDPAVDAMGQKITAQLQPIVQGQRKLFAHIQEQTMKDAKQDERLGELEGSQKRAMVGWGVFATGLSIALSAGWNWVSSKIKGTAAILLLLSLLATLGAAPVAVPLMGQEGAGSGFIGGDGLIVTAGHVLTKNDGSPERIVATVDGKKIPTTMPVVHPERDGGTIRADVKGPKVAYRIPKIGEKVTLIGFLYDADRKPFLVMTHGVVISGVVMRDGIECILIQGAAAPGMSGGPIVSDEDGAVVGMVLGFSGSHPIIRSGVMVR